MIEKLPSCEDPGDPQLLPVEEAFLRIKQTLPLLDQASAELVELPAALDRVLAENVVSPIDVPSYTNSAMDGYAISASDIPTEQQQTACLNVVGTAWAGRPFDGHAAPGQAVRIMTGAMMPQGADTVVIQEHVSRNETAGTIEIAADVEPGRNVRQAAEDVACGQVVFEKGERLSPAHIGQLASLGVPQVTVARPLRVAFFTTGDELRSLDASGSAELAPGELFDSNRYTLASMLARLGASVEMIDLGIVRDDMEATRSAFHDAANRADVIITSGGVSAGEADFVTKAIHEIGQVGFWKLAMRPGRPLAFGSIGNAMFFGLPGNPVAVMVTFYEFVQPALLHMMGASRIHSPAVSARCLSELRKSPGRTEYQRGVLSLDSDGHSVVETTGKQGAGRLSSMCAANCLIVLSPGQDTINPGDQVLVRPFFGLV